ncbi:MAG: NUDIX hydrolase [Desulfobacteraceae bacterium]|nr:NUDIX hydrolase [Desulfobacteraceae bacterium]
MSLIQAAIVVALRDAQPAPRILLVHRNPELPVQGDAWAFPGGHISVADTLQGPGMDKAVACAVREVSEETGLNLSPAGLKLMARWISPREVRPRFDTWMYITVTRQHGVEVDGREIVGHHWYGAGEALSAHHRGDIMLSPPAFVILSNLAAHHQIDTMLSEMIGKPAPRFEPRLVTLPDGKCALYYGDGAYDDRDIERSGPRHRLWMRSSGWRYERTFEDRKYGQAGLSSSDQHAL